MTKIKVLRDPSGAPMLSPGSERHAAEILAQEIPNKSPADLRALLAGMVEDESSDMDSAELACLLIGMRRSSRRRQIVDALIPHYQGIVDVLMNEFGYDSDRDRANFTDSARRCSEALFDSHPPRWLLEQETLYQLSKRFPGYREAGMASSTFEVVGSMVISANNVVWGMCPHHLLPIRYVIHMAYLPLDSGKTTELLGLSKLVRVAVAVGSQPILHESVPEMIADILYSNSSDDNTDDIWSKLRIKSDGSAVIADAMHTCICARGVRMESSRTSSTALRGAFMDNDLGARDEFIRHIARLTA